jgi:hypothetical protein
MSDYSHVVGHRFPGGTFRLDAYLAWLWADAVGADPREPAAHPSLAYFVALQGLGASVQDIFDLMGATAESGPMFGEASFEFSRPLRPDTVYDVAGEVTDVVRKEGRRAGVFDRLTFAVEVREHDGGAPVVVNRNTWIFPRKEAS